MDSGNEEIICEYDRGEQAENSTHARRVWWAQTALRREAQQRVRPASHPKIAAGSIATWRIAEEGLAGVEVLQIGTY
jgi:uncharacterized protein YijF (DUF1287 family)